VCDQKPRERGGHSPCWGAEPEEIKKIISGINLKDEIEVIGVDGRILLKCILKCLEIHLLDRELAKDKDSFRTVVNRVMKFPVPSNADNF
jgi:hypothetical protein